MSRGPTRNASPARLVRCSAGCGTLVWLAGALPTAADDDFECASCAAAHLRAEARLVEEHPDEFHARWAEFASESELSAGAHLAGGPGCAAGVGTAVAPLAARDGGERAF